MYADGGGVELPSEKKADLKGFFQWFYGWYKGISDQMNIFISVPNQITEIKDENGAIIDLFEKINQNIDAKPFMREILEKADKFGITLYLEPMPRYKYFLNNIEKRKKVSKEYLILYWEKFGFNLMDDGKYMIRLPQKSMGKLDKGGLLAPNGKPSNLTNEQYNQNNDNENYISLPDTYSRESRLKEILKNQGYDLQKIKMEEGGTAELLAPNGKPSNLTPEQWHLVRTPEFKKWFGNWENNPENSSKILNENGEPLVCFHGTNNEFFSFDYKYTGYAHDRGFYGFGFYFTFQKNIKDFKYSIGEASYYGNRIIPCFIKAKNPFNFSILSEYKGNGINYIGIESIVFLSNIAKMFPELSDVITVEKTVWNKDKREGEIFNVPISVLPPLIEKYSKQLKTYITENNRGERNIKSGYVKTELIEYDYTATGGEKGSYIDFDSLGQWEFSIKDGIQYPNDEVIEIGLICEAIKKYDGIDAKYYPEGYMTRYPQITEVIKRKHDCIMQGETGDELVVFEPTQIKIADGTNTQFDTDNEDIRYRDGGNLQVWHGSPYKFDDFETEKIGTGEGQQAFGWGLYFTDLEDIAKEYADRLRINKVLIGGKTLEEVRKEIDSPVFSWIEDYYVNRGMDKEQIIDQLKNTLKDKEWISKNMWVKPKIEMVLNYIKDKEIKGDYSNRNLYKVSFKKEGNDFVWLEWDKPLNKQSEKTKDALEKRFSLPSFDADFYSAGEFYRARARKYDSDKKASEELLSLGIDGIKYPAESISKGAKSDTSRGYNYVVFDDELVNIEKRTEFAKGGKFLANMKPYKSPEQIALENNVPLAYVKTQLAKGMKVESEHTNSKRMQKIIALQHLEESVEYYKKHK